MGSEEYLTTPGGEFALNCLLKRKPCPFYGFHLTKNLLIDSGGNECALISSGRKNYSPCKMERARMTPYWNFCDVKGGIL